MTELIKPEVSLAVLKIRLLEASADSIPAAGGDATANQTLTPRQRIFSELQVTGNAEERGLLAPTAQTADRASRRRGGRSVRYSYEALEDSVPGSCRAPSRSGALPRRRCSLPSSTATPCCSATGPASPGDCWRTPHVSPRPSS